MSNEDQALPSGQRRRVVVTGLGVLCALGNNPETVYNAMLNRESGIGPVTRFPTETLQCRIAGELDPNAEPLAGMQGLPYDDCAKYAIAASRQALEDSGLQVVPTDAASGTAFGGCAIPAARFGLALGTCNGGILSLEAQWTVTDLDREKTALYPFYRQSDDVASALGLGGPVATINTACAASGNAIGYAYDLLRFGYADAMLAGGSDPLSHTVYAGFNVLRALNPSPSTPFGPNFGLNLGEGAAFVVLETLESAVRRGATVYGELCGYGLSNDAYHETAPHPEGEGIKLAVEQALRRSGVSSREIEYVNAHGTGTKANDQAEVAGLRRAFEPDMAVPISSSKAYFGHNLGAAAAVELVTALYAIRQGRVPGTLRYDVPRSGCEDVHIVGESMKPLRPRYMLSNNSAFGGHNVSLVLRTEAAPGRGAEARTERPAKRGPRRRVAIVGIGAAGDRFVPGGILSAIRARRLQVPEPFSLKAFAPDKYERRMNAICQSSIGSALLACDDAGWPAEELRGDGVGFVYGTARGSTSSIAKYLGSVFEKWPEYASSIYFPHTVINSVSGKTAEKLGLTGFSSSLSTGGSEGIAAALYAAATIRDGLLSRCLIGAGDDASELSDAIDRAHGLETSAFKTEGGVCLALSELAAAERAGARAYAELLGFGMTFGFASGGLPEASALHRAIEHALGEAQLAPRDIDLILLHSPGRDADRERLRAGLAAAFGSEVPPTICLDELYGHALSFGSMLHLGAAAELVSGRLAQEDLGDWPELAHLPVCRTALTVSVTAGGNCAAAVVGSIEHGDRNGFNQGG